MTTTIANTTERHVAAEPYAWPYNGALRPTTPRSSSSTCRPTSAARAGTST